MIITNNRQAQKFFVQPLITKIGLLLCVGLFSGLLIYYLELTTFFVIIGIIISLIIILKPYWGLIVIIIAFPLMVGYSEGVDIVEQAFTALFGFWIIGWLLHLLTDHTGRWRFGWHPLSRPAILLGVVLIIGVLMGLINGATPIDTFRDVSQFAGYLVILPVAGIVRSRKDAWKLLILLLIIGLPSYIWSSFIWSARKFAYEEYGSLNAPLIGSAYFGPFIGALWPLVLLKTKKWIRALAVVSLSILMIYALGSGYRSSILSIVIMTAVSIWCIWSVQTGIKKFKVIFPFVIGVLFVIWVVYGTIGILPLPGGERTRQLYGSLVYPSALSQDLSFMGRREEARAALETFKKYPILGIGLGHHVKMYWKWGKWYETAFTQHIWITEMLMKYGILGSFVFLWYFTSILKFTYTIAKKTDLVIVKAISLGSFVWIFVNLIPTLGSFSNRGFAFTVAVIGGMLPALSKTDSYRNAR